MKKQIVVVGGGFAGINFVKRLAFVKNIHVTLVDKNNYNFFPPLLYQVATGFLEVSNVSYPFRKLLRGKSNISFRLGTLEKFFLKKTRCSYLPGSYHMIIWFSLLAQSNFFNIENIQKSALPMKTVDDAIEIRNYLLLKTEEATIATDPVEKKKLSTIVIAGGGPTGVEIAGMLAEMRKNILPCRWRFHLIIGYEQKSTEIY